MLKKSIKYTDFNGVEKSTVHYFNLSSTELIEMELGEVDGLQDMLQQIIDSKDTTKIMEIFKRIVLGSYGKKSEDGERFVKNDENREEFRQSAAYDALFFELITGGENTLADFIKGIMPNNLSALEQEINKKLAEKEASASPVVTELVSLQTTMAPPPPPATPIQP